MMLRRSRTTPAWARAMPCGSCGGCRSSHWSGSIRSRICTSGARRCCGPSSAPSIGSKRARSRAGEGHLPTAVALDPAVAKGDLVDEALALVQDDRALHAAQDRAIAVELEAQVFVGDRLDGRRYGGHPVEPGAAIACLSLRR